MGISGFNFLELIGVSGEDLEHKEILNEAFDNTQGLLIFERNLRKNPQLHMMVSTSCFFLTVGKALYFTVFSHAHPIGV